jgi:hypothetical protein
MALAPEMCEHAALFALLTVTTILVVGALSYPPVLALGPASNSSGCASRREPAGHAPGHAPIGGARVLLSTLDEAPWPYSTCWRC